MTWVLDDRFFELDRIFGNEKSQLAAQSHAQAIDSIERFVEQENISCDFKRLDGYLFAPPDDFEILDKEWKALQKIKLKSELVDRTPWKKFDTGRCIRFPNQGQFHILKYLDGMLKAFVRMGGRAYGYTPAQNIKNKKPCAVKTPHATIHAKDIIVATCTPVNDRVTIHTKQAAYRTYVIGALIPDDKNIADALYWDTLVPYHYIRLQSCAEDKTKLWLLIGGEDHKTGQEKHVDQNYKVLADWAKERFSINDIQYRWSGQVYEPVDSLAFIGKNPHDDHVYIATGDSGAGLLIPDLIEGKTHKWQEFYDPARKTIATIPEFVKENFNTLIQLDSGIVITQAC